MSSISLEMAERLLMKFDGSKSKLYEFIDNCDKAMILVNPEQKEMLFTIIETKITDKARAFVRNRDFSDWEALKTHLLDTFGEKRTLAQWQIELNTCKQNFKENVMSFANRVETCYVKIINCLDRTVAKGNRSACVELIKNEALNVFLNGLNKDLTILVKSQKPDSLENAIAIALDEEQQLKSKFETTRFNNLSFKNSHSQILSTEKLFCKYCKKTNHSIENCFKLKNKNNNLNQNNKFHSNSKINNRSNNSNFNNSNRSNNYIPSRSNTGPLNAQGPRQPAMPRNSH